MQHVKQNSVCRWSHAAVNTRVQTTLFDVIEAVAAVMGPAQDRYVGAVVAQMMADCSARFEKSGGNGTEKAHRPQHLHVCGRAL